MNYHQLTEKERYRMEIYLGQGFSKAAIAKALGKHRSTIYRELRRNSIELHDRTRTYDAVPAQAIAKERRIEGCEYRYKVRGAVLALLRKGLRAELSPEIIAGRLTLELGQKIISASSIYRYLHREIHRYPSERLDRLLPRYNLYRQRRKCRRAISERTGLRRSIRERSKSCDLRAEVGHFERDLMEGKRGSQALLVVIDRKSRKIALELVKRRPKSVHVATKRVLRRMGGAKSLTNDNGYEFISSRKKENELGVRIYFTDPSSPWQRGSVENVIGMIRKYFPKKQSLSSVRPEQVRKIEVKLNKRPRKILNFETPDDIFHQRKNSRSRFKKLSHFK